MSYCVEFAHWVPCSHEQVFLFFADPYNLPRIMPSSHATRIERLALQPPPPPPRSNSVLPLGPLAGVGSEIATSFRIAPPLPFRRLWVARITEFEWNDHFADVQVEGPFARWLHRHELAEEVRNGISGTMVRDRVEYEIGFGVLGPLAQTIFVDRQMKSTFAHRQRVLEGLLQATAFDHPGN
jgi:ligand-binding SRPBCC domain-containing protein